MLANSENATELAINLGCLLAGSRAGGWASRVSARVRTRVPEWSNRAAAKAWEAVLPLINGLRGIVPSTLAPGLGGFRGGQERPPVRGGPARRRRCRRWCHHRHRRHRPW
jgi:hypothetical protein